MSVMERRRVSARRESLLGDEPGAFASARFVRITPMKARRVVDMVRGQDVQDALDHALLSRGALSSRHRFIDTGGRVHTVRSLVLQHHQRVADEAASLRQGLQCAVEQDVVPFCQASGVALVPHTPLAGGFLTGKYRRGEQARRRPDRRRGIDADLG